MSEQHQQTTTHVQETEKGPPQQPADSQNANTEESSSRLKRKSMKPRSEVWDHFKTFIDQGMRKGKCNYCDKVYNCDPKKNGTSTLKNHMNICKKHPHSIETRQSELSLQSILEAGGGEVANVTSWKFDQDFIRSKLAYMIVVDELPFRFVEGDGFKVFMTACQPRFKIPSRWTVGRDCYQLYLDEKLKLQNFFKKTSQRICITTDTWTSLQRINYMCITSHFIDKDWKLHKKILNFTTIESHKGEEMAIQIDGCLREWGISKIFSVTVDNASSNDTCISYLKTRFSSRGCDLAKGKHIHMRCIAHVINLIVVDGLMEMSLSVKRVRDAVRFIRQSPARIVKFKECCETENLGSKSMLCLDVSTRWNSTYLMLNVAQKFEKAFEIYNIKEPNFRIELTNGVPTIVDWENIRMMVDVLQTFYELTLRISGSLYVTSNEFYHEISSVNCLLKEWMISGDEEVRKMGTKMNLKYEKYWGDPTRMNKVIYVAVVVDPRYKLEFVEYALIEEYGKEVGYDIAKSVKEVVKELFEEYKVMCQPQHDSQTQEQNQGSSSSQLSQLESLRKLSRYSLGQKFIQHKTESGEVESKCDLDVYLSERVLVVDKDDFDILKWWKLNQNRFPILSQFVRDVLAMPISTVASESAFSTGGRVLDSFRSSLTPKVVEALICAQDWLRRPKALITIDEDLQEIERIEEALSSVGLSDVNENTMDTEN